MSSFLLFICVPEQKPLLQTSGGRQETKRERGLTLDGNKTHKISRRITEWGEVHLCLPLLVPHFRRCAQTICDVTEGEGTSPSGSTLRSIEVP